MRTYELQLSEGEENIKLIYSGNENITVRYTIPTGETTTIFVPKHVLKSFLKMIEI